MFREYMYGESSMAEIVQKTGINRKTWNQRFSRLQRRKSGTLQNNNSEIMGNRGDEPETKAESVSINYKSNNINNRAYKFVQILGAIAVMVAVYFIYMAIKSRNTVTHSNSGSDKGTQ